MVKPVPEKRKSTRVAIETPLKIKLADEQGNTVEVQARTRDVSRNGVFFFIDQSMSEGSSVDLILMLPEEVTQSGRQWVCCRARIVRVEGSGEGVQGVAAILEDCAILPES